MHLSVEFSMLQAYDNILMLVLNFSGDGNLKYAVIRRKGLYDYRYYYPGNSPQRGSSIQHSVTVGIRWRGLVRPRSAAIINDINRIPHKLYDFVDS